MHKKLSVALISILVVSCFRSPTGARAKVLNSSSFKPNTFSLASVKETAAQQKICQDVRKKYGTPLPQYVKCKTAGNCQLMNTKHSCSKLKDSLKGKDSEFLKTCYAITSNRNAFDLSVASLKKNKQKSANLWGDDGFSDGEIPEQDLEFEWTNSASEASIGTSVEGNVQVQDTWEPWTSENQSPTIDSSESLDSAESSSDSSPWVDTTSQVDISNQQNTQTKPIYHDADSDDTCTEEPCIEKPVIYLYPTAPQNIEVKLGFKGRVIASYPTIPANLQWNVLAKPDGELTVKSTGQTFPYLFWEGDYAKKITFPKKGFVVEGVKAREFLEARSQDFSLNARETADFVTYWYPRMQKNKFNKVAFLFAEYEDIAPLQIKPSPDTSIRLFMVFQKIPKPISLEQPIFPKVIRKGFTMVEWGGMELQ